MPQNVGEWLSDMKRSIRSTVDVSGIFFTSCGENVDLCKRTNCHNMGLELQWLGHVLRKDQDLIPKVASDPTRTQETMEVKNNLAENCDLSA